MVSITYRMFWNLGKPMAVRPDAAGVHARARRETLAIGSKRVVVYRWGTGPKTVLLVHGWRGRASQFAAIIATLEAPDRTIVAFDAPGNGDSPGDRTDLRDYVAAIRVVGAETNGLELLVGHSFGVMAVFVAVREGVRVQRLASIAGISNISYTFEAFARALDLPPRVKAGLRRKIERSAFDGDTSIWRRFVSELDPTDQTPLLIVHDREDRAIDLSESEAIASAHLGPITELYTVGLGHTRVLSDPAVLQAIVQFANEPVRTRSAAE
jgi:pimeloyl-ACP methyl ester carboxylesterase